MKRISQCLLVVLSIAVIAPACAYGDLIAYEGFGITHDPNETLVGHNEGTGWATAWDDYGYDNGEKTRFVDYVESPLSPEPSNGAIIQINTKAFDNDADTAVYRALDSGLLTGTVYASFYAQAKETADTAWGFSFAYYDSATEAFSLSKDNLIGDGASGHNYSIGTATDGHVASSVDDTTAQLVVAKVDIDTGDMTLYLLDPDGQYVATEAEATVAASLVGTESLGDVNAIRLFAGYSNSSNYASVNIDDIRVGTTWSDVVVSVPEPSSVALLACGLIGLLAYAWRKRK